MSYIAARFHRTNWSDWVSVISHLAHWIRTGKRPKYTHVSLLIRDSEEDNKLYSYHFHYRGVTKGPYIPDDGEKIVRLDLYTNAEQDNFVNITQHRIYTLGQSCMALNLLDAYLFMRPKYHHLNTCITFVMKSLGMVPQNLTVEELLIMINSMLYEFN